MYLDLDILDAPEKIVCTVDDDGGVVSKKRAHAPIDVKRVRYKTRLRHSILVRLSRLGTICVFIDYRQ